MGGKQGGVTSLRDGRAGGQLLHQPLALTSVLEARRHHHVNDQRVGAIARDSRQALELAVLVALNGPDVGAVKRLGDGVRIGG